MFWVNEEAEDDFFKRLLHSRPFKAILGQDFNGDLIEHYAKHMTASIIGQIMRRDFDEGLRDACVQETGRTCCQMVLEHFPTVAETHGDACLPVLEELFAGLRRLRRVGDIVWDEVRGNGQCWCPIVHSMDSAPAGSAWCQCGRHARQRLFQTIFQRPVTVELVDSVLWANAATCIWRIDLRHPADEA
jgi:hypothetical protein